MSSACFFDLAQVHSVFAFCALITCLWSHRRINGGLEDLDRLVENGIETLAAVAFPDRALDSRKYQLLDWSHYRADSQTGRMSTSQLAKGAAFLGLCELYLPLQELRNILQ